MKKIKKLFILSALLTFGMLTMEAQTDTISRQGSENREDANRIQNPGSPKQDVHHEHGTMQDHKNASGDDGVIYQKGSSRDSVNMHMRNKNGKALGQQPDKAVPAKYPVSKNSGEKNNVKSKSNKTMYLVPDSTMKKDSLR